MGCTVVSLLRTFMLLIVIALNNFRITVATNPITMTTDEAWNAVMQFDGLIKEKSGRQFAEIESCWAEGKGGEMSETAIQDAMKCTSKTTLTKEYSDEANAFFQNAAQTNQLQNEFGKVKASWMVKVDNMVKREAWKLTAASAVSAILTNHQKDILQHCLRESKDSSEAEKSDATKTANAQDGTKSNRIVVLVAQGSFGGIGLEMVKMLSELGYFVDVVTVPRIKTSLTKNEDDDSWKDLLKEIEALDVNGKIRIVGRFHVGPTVAAVNNKIQQIISTSNDQKHFNAIKKKLAAELETALAEEAVVIAAGLQEIAKTGYLFAIESLVPAGFNHPKEGKKKYVIRYQLMEIMVDWLNKLKEDSGKQGKYVFLCSIELPVNSTYEHGHYHVSTDGKLAVTKLKYYIPDILICIKYPEEAIRALDGPSTHQFAGTKYMYLTFLKYPNFPEASMAECMDKCTDSGRFDRNVNARDNFFANLVSASTNSIGGIHSSNFLKLNWPVPVSRCIAYEPEVFVTAKDKKRDISFNYWENPSTPPLYHKHEIGEDN